MPCCRSDKCSKYSSIIGAHFIVAPVSFLWIYGNLSAYVDSYYRYACSEKCMDGNSQWTVGLIFAMICPGTLMTKHLAGIFGLKLTGIMAALVLNASLFASVWTVGVSEAGTTLLLGAVMGFVQGTTSTVAFEYVSGWAREKSYLFVATVTGVSTLVSMPQNQIITAIVNPRNLKPDVTQGSRTFFSQPEVLDRVPTALFVYAAMTLCLQIIGYLLLAPQAKPPTHDTSLSGASEEAYEYSEGRNNSPTMNHLKASKLKINVSNEEHYSPKSLSSLGMEAEPLKSTQRKTEKFSLTPSEALKTPVFYAVFMFGMATMYAFSLKANYYKQFGLLFIHDDHYLTLVGTLIPIVASSSRVLLGLALNKRLVSIKTAIVFSLTINSVLCAFWYIVPQYNAVLYMFLILGLAVVQSMFYMILPVVALQKFGPAHFSTNYGMLLVCLFIVGLLSPAVGSPLLHFEGWHWLFTSASAFCLLSLIFVVCANFNTAVTMSDV